MSNYVIVGGELYHHGVKGMKWGVRRYQNKDGSLTPAGKKRQAMKEALGDYRKANKAYNRSLNKAYGRKLKAVSPVKGQRTASKDRWDDAYDKSKAAREAREKFKQSKKDFRDAKNQERLVKRGEQLAKRELAKVERQNSSEFVRKHSKQIAKAESLVNTSLTVYGTAARNKLRADYGLDEFYDD